MSFGNPPRLKYLAGVPSCPHGQLDAIMAIPEIMKLDIMPATQFSGYRGRPSPADTLIRRAELLRVAREQFTSNGYRATTMAHIATMAGLTKRTLYSWYGDKASLFHACVISNAERLPLPDIDDTMEAPAALCAYVVALIHELAQENNLGIMLLFVREGREFPELGGAIDRSFTDYVVVPLAAYLDRHGIKSELCTKHAALFVSMALAPIHNVVLLGRALPDKKTIRQHARMTVDLFLNGSPLNVARQGAGVFKNSSV